MSSYLLVIEAMAMVELAIGALGGAAFKPGCYLYVGSARRHLQARLARHRRRDKKCRWHIDFLLSREEFSVRAVWVSKAEAECELAQSLIDLPGCFSPLRGFGASDCRCQTHLFRYQGDLTALEHHCRAQGFRRFSPLTTDPEDDRFNCN